MQMIGFLFLENILVFFNVISDQNTNRSEGVYHPPTYKPLVDNSGFDKILFSSPGMFSLKGQPGCRWLCIGRKGNHTDMTRLKHAKICHGREPCSDE